VPAISQRLGRTVTDSSPSNYETGRRTIPASVLLAAAQLTRTSLDELLYGESLVVLWQEFITLSFEAGVYWLTRKDGSLVEVAYQATANVGPGVHVSRLTPHDSLNEPFERSKLPRQPRRAVS
jgi:hypothetical protein